MQKQIKLVKNLNFQWALYINDKRVLNSICQNVVSVEKVLHQLTEHGIIASMEVWRYNAAAGIFGEFPLQFDETEHDMQLIKRHDYIAA